jgi:hypothetical protein
MDRVGQVSEAMQVRLTGAKSNLQRLDEELESFRYQERLAQGDRERAEVRREEGRREYVAAITAVMLEIFDRETVASYRVSLRQEGAHEAS